MFIAWTLMRALRPPPVPSATADAVMQVVFLPLRKAAPAIPATPVRHRAAAAPRDRAAAPESRLDVAPAAVTPVTSRPMTATFLQQAVAVAAETARLESPPHDLLADRPARLPGRAGGRFRMQGPLTPAQVVAVVGGLFGGVDARAERCQRNRQNLANQVQQGDSAVLQAEMDTERRFCRP